jgi:hypothetical protein
MKVLPYAVRRVSQIAAQVEAARRATPLMHIALVTSPPVTPLLAPKAQHQPHALPPRCIRCEAPAHFFLCDTNGRPLQQQQGGFCPKCTPEQGDEETTPTTGTPASLSSIEAAAQEYDERHQMHQQNLEALREERIQLTVDLATMLAYVADSPYSGDGPTQEEIEAAEARLTELDELLILDDPRPFIYGFDDLPAAYFTA